MLGLLSAIAISLILLFGVMFADQGSSKVYWANRNFEKTREMAERFEPGTFISSKGEKLRYRLLKPVNYDPHKKYPLVVCLPYGGQPATDTIRQIEGAAAAEILSSEVNRLKYPAFLFVPNVPAGAGWGGIANYPTVDTLVLETIVAVEQAEAGIDVKRCYITGISRGGYGAWHFITIRPDLFAAAIPVCGGGNPQLGKNVVDVSVWAFHGEKDQNVPVNGSRDMIAAIKKAGGHPLYTEYKGEGHNIWDKVSGTQGLWDWLFAQQRN
jgi:predicted peptidase